MMCLRVFGLFALVANVCLPLTGLAQERNPELLNSIPLKMEGDIASHLVEGVDKFLLRELERSIEKRPQYWNRNFSSREAYEASIEPNRKRLAKILGVVDPRAANTEPQLMASVAKSSLVGRGNGFEIHTVSWPAFSDVNGYGLLLLPTDKPPVANVIAIPDCNTLPEQLAGLLPGVEPKAQYARRLAESGCRVLVPMLINRKEKLPQLSNREWLYRSAFEMGRGLNGYEVQKVLAAVDWFSSDQQPKIKTGVVGWGEGGLISLYAAALDSRIDSTCVSGYFDSRQNIWQEPLDRNVFGLLQQFGDAELASMILPRALVIEACRGPEAKIPGGRGAPARVGTPDLSDVRAETERARKLVVGFNPAPNVELVISGVNGNGPTGSKQALQSFLTSLSAETTLPSQSQLLENLLTDDFSSEFVHAKQMHELDRHTQRLLEEGQYVRQKKTMGQFDFTSLEAYEKSSKPVRQNFHDDVIGRFINEPLAARPRARKFQESEKWTCYEVVLDVYPDVMAYGLLLVPKNLKPGEKRPVVVCQHGLEGRPQHTIGAEGAHYYSAFSAKLAERGFVTFAPQNLYIFTDRFRSLQRKANPLGKTLYSIIVPQHQQIVNWLKTLDFVDPERIGFYGLSYGGKTAMRVPSIVTDYCLSICSADFNDWVDKNASTRNPRSYAAMGEYEIFEFDLGQTFNYAEMAALIAPRPFMVERGHFDGVADDWTVAFEYAKVRYLYAARLKIPGRTEIEWFDGPHKINGVGTFDFLHRHLNWPNPSKPQVQE